VFSRYFNFTTGIRSDNLAAIAQAVTHLLEQEEGCRLITQIPQLAIDLEQLRDLPVWERPRLWIFALFSGRGGWTIVKTWPVEWLCQRAIGASRLRLSALAMQLGCDAFHFRVTRDINGILLEADAKGCIFISGWNDYEGANSDDEIHQFYDEQIDASDDLISQFSLLKVPQSMQAAMRVNEDPEIARKKAEYKRLTEENRDSELIVHLMDEVYTGYAERIDKALAEVVDKSKSCWYLNDLLYNAYAEPRQLEDMGVQLLYFQPPTTYNPTFKTNLPTDSLAKDEEDKSF
jgi:hypothetical protein